jgi:hypothetical protein
MQRTKDRRKVPDAWSMTERGKTAIGGEGTKERLETPAISMEGANQLVLCQDSALLMVL